MSWSTLIPLMLGSGLVGAIMQRLLDHFLGERARRRSQVSDLGIAAAHSAGQVLESIVLLLRDYTSRTGRFDLDSETRLRLTGDLGNRLVRHVQLIPDADVREELRLVDVGLGMSRAIAAGLPEGSTRDGYLRHDANVCVALAVGGLIILGTFMRGERVQRSPELQALFAAMHDA